jgi:hypothetical protein
MPPFNECLQNINEYPSEACRLRALKLILSPEDISIAECGALSCWDPLLSMVASIRESFTGEGQREAVRESIDALERKGIIAEDIPSLTSNIMVTFLNQMTAYLAHNVSNALEGSDLSSDSRVKASIDKALKSCFKSFFKGFILHKATPLAKDIVQGGVSGFLAESIIQGIGANNSPVMQSAIGGGVGGFVSNIEGGVWKAAVVAATAATAGGVSTALGADKDSSKAIAAGISSMNPFKMIEKRVHSYGWKLTKGNISFKERDFTESVSKYMLSAGMGLIAKEVSKAIVSGIYSYMKHVFTHTSNPQEKKFASKVMNITDSKQQDMVAIRRENNKEKIYNSSSFDNTVNISDSLIGNSTMPIYHSGMDFLPKSPNPNFNVPSVMPEIKTPGMDESYNSWMPVALLALCTVRTVRSLFREPVTKSVDVRKKRNNIAR